MATLGLSKVFILDKYFTELQKFWETEKKLQGTKLEPYDSIFLLILMTKNIFFSFLLVVKKINLEFYDLQNLFIRKF